MKGTILKGCLALALVTTSGMAAAAGSGWYGALDAGRSKISSFCDGVPAGISCNKSATAYRAQVGYQLNQNWAIEGGYVNLGKYKLSGAGVTGSISGKGVQASVVGTLPLSNSFSLFGKVGAIHLSEKGSIVGGGLTESVSEKETKATYGAGVQLRLGESASVRAQYEKLTNDVNMVSAGLVLHF